MHKAWCGKDFTGRACVIVAESKAEAVKLAGVTPVGFPFRFERTDGHWIRSGVYYKNSADQWIRKDSAK